MEKLTIYTPSADNAMQLIDSIGRLVGSISLNRHGARDLTLFLWVPGAWYEITDIEDLDDAFKAHGYKLANKSRSAVSDLINHTGVYGRCRDCGGPGTVECELEVCQVCYRDFGSDFRAAQEDRAAQEAQTAASEPALADETCVSQPWAITVRPTGNGYDIQAIDSGRRIAHMYLDEENWPNEPDQIILIIEHPDCDGTDTIQVDSAEDLSWTLEQETGYCLTYKSFAEIRDLIRSGRRTTKYLDRH